MLRRLLAFLRGPVPEEILYNFKCGHRSALEVVVEAFEETRESDLQPNELEYCPKCLAHMAIPCGKCGGAIFPFEPVGSTFVQTPVEGAHVRDGDRVTICIRCCEMMCDAIGTWKPPGYIDTKDLPYTVS